MKRREDQSRARQPSDISRVGARPAIAGFPEPRA